MRSRARVSVPAGLALAIIGTMAAHAVEYRDDFARAGRGVNQINGWEAVSGRWEVVGGRLTADGAGDGKLFCAAAPDSDRQTIEADVTPEKRAGQGGWVLAGLMVYYDANSFWQLTLVAAPNDERRYVELLESLDGRWQAQNDPPLPVLADEGRDVRWEYGRTYRMKLELAPEGIGGFVSDAEGKQLAHIAFGFVPPGGGKHMPAVDFGRAGLVARDVTVSFDNVSIHAQAPGAEPVAGLKPEEGPNGRAAILDDDLPGLTREGAKATAAVLRETGIGVTSLTAAQLATPGVLQRSRFDLLVLVDSQTYPAAAIPSLQRYLREGGKLLCLGGPPFSRLCWQLDGAWRDRAGLVAWLNATPAKHVWTDFERDDVGTWRVASNNPEARTEVQRDPTTAGHGNASLRFHVEDLTGWTTFAGPRPYGPFPEGDTLTCFDAKGGPDTKHLVLEWHESDESRWIASVPLTTQWQHFALPPEAFEYWRDSPSTGRGGAGDRFHPEHATQLIIGLAQSHASIPNGPHTFWVDDIGSAPNPPGEMPVDQEADLEILSPYYKTFAFTEGGVTGVAPVRRQQGLGFRRGLGRRWVPVAFADGLESHIATASHLVNHGGILRGSAWALTGTIDPPPWRTAESRKLIAREARLLARGVFVGEAGTEQFHYDAGESVTFGAKLCDFGRAPTEFEVRAEITQAGTRDPLVRERRTVRCEPGETREVEFVWQRPQPGDAVFSVRFTVEADGQPLDTIEHEFEIAMPPTKTKGFVAVRDGDFWVGNRKWYPFGVNYWPSYVIGEPTLDRTGAEYDPGWIEEELATLESLGMNMVSFTSPAEHWRDLRDFLRRCGNHGIRVNLFIGGADPMAFSPDAVGQQIDGARLAENPAIFAYDIAWEPRLGQYAERSRWDVEWERWIVERYGSIESAEKDWGFAVPRTAEGKVTGPSDAQLPNDGEQRRMVAAYRRFADDLISQHYNRATRFIRTLDPNHLISTRSGYGGTGPCGPAVMAFDMVSMAKHFDFASPEGWGMTGDRDTILQSGITTAYGTYVMRGKPVMWSEFGMQKWDRAKERPDPERVREEQGYYDDMYHMMLTSGAHGAVPWWWPGGFRVGEDSDFGISAPNSRERPVWKSVRKYAPMFAQPRAPRRPDAWITIDRDASVGGYHDVYMKHKAEYGRLLGEGKFPGLRTEGTGTDSANTPLVAVGDVPYNGSNPPKYLNAEFDWVRVKVGDGEWEEAADGAEIAVPKDVPVQLWASIGNTGEATWLSGEGTGRVFLVSAATSDIAVKAPITANAACLEDAEVRPFGIEMDLATPRKLVLQMESEGRMRFGQEFELTFRGT